MKLTKTKLIITSLALTTILAGCVSKSYDKGKNTSDALQATADAVSTVEAKTIDTLGALNNLNFHPQDDLRPPFDAYAASVTGLKAAADDLDVKVTAMQNNAQIYLNNWSNQLSTIQNGDIRTNSAIRYEDVSAKLQSVSSSYYIVKDSLKPFTADLTDIQTALGLDLTSGGLDSIKNVVTKTKVDAVPLRTSIKKLKTDFSKLSAAMAPVSSGQ